MRVLAWPRSPRRMTSWPARRAFSSWGSTVSSNPRTPSMRGAPPAIRGAALRRSSSWTGVDSQPEARSSPSVEGRSDGGSGGMVALMGPSLGPPAVTAAPAASTRGPGAGRAVAGRDGAVDRSRRPACAQGFWCEAPPKWKDDEPSEPGGSVCPWLPRGCAGAGPVRSVRGGRARRHTEVGRWEAVRWDGGPRAREHDTPGSQARARRAGRGSGRAPMSAPCAATAGGGARRPPWPS